MSFIIRLSLLGLILTLLVILLATVSAADISDETTTNRPSTNVLATDFIHVNFSEANHGLPTEITFNINGRKSLTVVDRIVYTLTEPLVFSQGDIELNASAKTYASIQSLQSGQKVRFQTMLSKEAPFFSLYAASLEPLSGKVEVIFRGIDRIIHQEGKKFAAIILEDAQESFWIKSNSLILQNRHTQDGLCLILSPNLKDADFMVTPRRHSRGLSISFTQDLEKPGMERILQIKAFRGDALLAMEDAKKFIAMKKKRPFQPPTRATKKPTTPKQGMINKREYFSDRGRAFKPLLADPREASFHISFLADRHEDIHQDLGFGADLGLLWLRLEESEELTLTARGLVTSRFDSLSSSFDLLNTDFIGGIALGFTKNQFSFETFIYHQSSHLGDEKLEHAERARIDYSRETIRFIGASQFSPLRLYAGPSYTFHAMPEKIENTWSLQLGAEYKFTVIKQNMFLACDLNSRQENNWAVNTTARMGLELGDILLTKNRQYLFGELYNGYSPMGQYYDVKERYLMLGVGYNFR